MKSFKGLLITIALLAFVGGVFYGCQGNEKAVVIKPPVAEVETPKVFEKNNNSLVYEYHLQLGAFKLPYFASQLAQKVQKRGYTVIQRREKVNGEIFNLVEVGPFKKYNQAKKHKKFLEQDNPTLGKIFIKKRIKD